MLIDALIIFVIIWACAGFLCCFRFAADRQLCKDNIRDPDKAIPGFSHIVWVQYLFVLVLWPTYYWR